MPDVLSFFKALRPSFSTSLLLFGFLEAGLCYSEEKVTTLVLVRHAQTTDNAAKIWSGTKRDPHFSPEGQEKEAEITQLLQEQYPHPAAILSAPFYRSLETISPFAEEQGIPVISQLD